MAEANSNSKTGLFAKAQKQISRTKTKVLQNLGKAEKTTDDVFKDYVLKLDRQQEVAQHLQKELKTYSHCVRDLSQACKSLQHAFLETYEPEWTEESTFKSQLQAFELLWNDYLQNLQDNVINPMNAYLQSFPVLKSKVSKRGRKLVDYDNSRHSVEVLQSSKKRDELKLQKAQDDLKDVKRIFDELNNELHTELPEFYNSRVTFYADLYSRFFGAEHTLHSEVGKTSESITEVAQSLAKDFEHYKYQPKRPVSVTDSSVNGETPVTASPSLRSSHSPQKEMVYTNQDEINQQSILKPKRKAPIAPGHLTPVTLIQAGVSCISLETTSSQQSNLSISSESHLSVKSENLKDNGKYFTKWKERFRLKRSKQISLAIDSGPLEQQKGLEGPVCNILTAAVNKVQGVKSLDEKLAQSSCNAQCEKRKTSSLPDYLREDKNSEPLITNLMQSSSMEKEGVECPLSNDGHVKEQEEMKMNPAISRVSFSIPEDTEEGKLESQQLRGSVDSELPSDSSILRGELLVKKKAVRISETTVVFCDDGFEMKNDTVEDAKLGVADLDFASDVSESNLLDSVPDKTAITAVKDEDADEFSAIPNEDSSKDVCLFVPLDEIAKKHLSVKKSKTVNHTIVREHPALHEVGVKKSAPELDKTLGVNLQLLPDVKRNDSSIKWNKEKHSWVNKEMYSSGKTEVHPLLSDEDDDQYASCCDDFYKMSTLPESNPLPIIKENQADDRQLPVEENTSSGSKSLDSSKNFYRMAFIESSSSAEDEPETSLHRLQILMAENTVQKTEQVVESKNLFNKEKLNFLSQHLSKKHRLQSRKILDGLSDSGSPEREIDNVDGGNAPLKEKKEHLVKKHLVPNSGHVTEEETDDIKSECLSYTESEVEPGHAGVHSVGHSASVDLPQKKSKSPARKLSEVPNTGSGFGRIPVETMPESWKDDNMKNDYKIVTVFTEDLSPSAVVGTELSGPLVNNSGPSMPQKTAITVNLCLNEMSPKFDKPLPDISPEIGKERLFSSDVLNESDSSTYTNCPKHIDAKPKSLDKLCCSKETKLNRAESLDEKSLMSRKVTENLRCLRSDRSAKDDTDIGSMSDSSVSFAVTAHETLMKEESASEPSVSMASNRWNLRGLMSMLMPVTVQTLASHTKSYINSYLSSNKPSEIDAIEIQKIIAENLSKEDYYNLIGKSRDSSVDISIHLEELTAMPDDTLTTQDDFKSFSAAAKLDEPDADTTLEVDKQTSESNMTNHLSEHEYPNAINDLVNPEITQTKDKEKQQYDSSDLDILEKHFHTVLLDIVSKGSSQLKKSSEMARKPKSASKLASSEKLDSESSRPQKPQRCDSMLTVEDLDKESSYNLHDAMLSRLQMSLPLLSKSPGKNESGAVSEDGSLDNACSWTFSKESLFSKSSAGDDVQQGKDETKIASESGFTGITSQGVTGQKKFAEPLSPPLDSALQKSLAIRRDALKCPAEDDECLTNSSLDDSDQCTHASQNSVDTDHSTIFLGHCYDPLFDVARCVTVHSIKDKENKVSNHLKSYGTFTHKTSKLSQSERVDIYDSNFLQEDDSSSSTCGWSSHEPVIIIEDKDMMDFKDIDFQCENYMTSNTVDQGGENSESLYNNMTEVLNELKHTSTSMEVYLNNLKIMGCSGDESVVAELVDSQQECKIGDTAYGCCVVSHDVFSGSSEEMRDFGAGDDKDSDDYFNSWDHDEEKVVGVIDSENIWVEHKRQDEPTSDSTFIALGRQPEWNDVNKMDVNVTSQDLTMSELSLKKNSTSGCVLPSESNVLSDSLTCEVLKKEKKVRFSDLVEVCSGVESKQVVDAEVCVPRMSMTLYRDNMNDYDIEDTSHCSRGSLVTTEDLNSWIDDQFHGQLDWIGETADECDLVHSVQFTNSQYMSDESSFYKKFGDKYIREVVEARTGNTQCTNTEVVQATEVISGNIMCNQPEVVQPTEASIGNIMCNQPEVVQPTEASIGNIMCNQPEVVQPTEASIGNIMCNQPEVVQPTEASIGNIMCNQPEVVQPTEASICNIMCNQSELMRPTEASIGNIMCNQSEVMQPSEASSKITWTSFKGTDSCVDLDIFVHIQPVCAGSSGLKCDLSLLDEELMNCKSEPYCLKGSRVNNEKGGEYLFFDRLTDVSSAKKLAGTAVGDTSDIHTCLKNTAMVNADYRNNLNIIKDMMKSHVDKKSNPNTSILNPYDISCVDNSSTSCYSSDKDNTRYHSQMLSAKQYFCTCRNIICMGCKAHSSQMLEHSDYQYFPLKFAASLEDALKMYQDTHFNPSASQMSVQESSDKSNDVGFNSEDKEFVVEDMTDIKQTDSPAVSVVIHSETSASCERSLEDIISYCPSVEVALLTCHSEPREGEILEEILEEFKTDETELFPDVVKNNVDNHNTEDNLRANERPNYNEVVCVIDFTARKGFSNGRESYNFDTNRETCHCSHPEVSGLLETSTGTEVTFPLYKLFLEDLESTASKYAGLEQHIIEEPLLESETSLDHCIRNFRTDWMKDNDALGNKCSVHKEYNVASHPTLSLEAGSSVDGLIRHKDILNDSSDSTAISNLNSGQKDNVMNVVSPNLLLESSICDDPLSKDFTNETKSFSNTFDVSKSFFEKQMMKNCTAVDLYSVDTDSLGNVNPLLHSPVKIKRDSSKSEINGHKIEHPPTERPISAPRTLIGMKSSVKKSDDSDEEVVDNEDDDQRDTNIYVEPVEPQKSPAAGNTTSESSDSSGSEDEDAVTSPPPNTLYMVHATHKYIGEDVDELSFEAGEIIYVIEFENPEEQDDGWQMGIKKSDNMKGVFPENFTLKIS